MERLDAIENHPRAGDVNSRTNSVDCVYIAACAGDARLTRICVASVRYFYPDVPIKLLAGGRLPRNLVEQLRRYWGVGLAAIPRGEYGLGFVKLEPLFGPAGERFLVLDSDTVLTGPVLGVWAVDAPFLVDDETQTESDTRRLYYDWQKVRDVDPSARPPAFVFNSGQLFGTAGVLSREDFTPWVQWSMPRRLSHPDRFMPGDQGVLNYVINQQAALHGLHVERRTIMRWPGHGLAALNASMVSTRLAPPLVVHWAGMKTRLLRNTVGADLLMFFEKFYYERLPAGGIRRILASCFHVWLQGKHFFAVRLLLTYRKWVARLSSKRLAVAAKHSSPT
jgi:hypothetical protein